MFDNHYPFTRIFSKEIKKNKFLVKRDTYQFNTDIQQYLIEVELYQENIYVIKFFPKKQKSNSKRFNTLTHEHKMGRIVGTCINLILQILKKDSLASFGFLGSHTVDFSRKYEESRECTKRFKIYRYAIFDLVGEETFAHYMEEKNSTFLFVNKKKGDTDHIKDVANEMFTSIFPTLYGI